jgi:hypothetical protein
VDRFVAVIVAPAMLPPEGSVTVPCRAPVSELCATAGEVEASNADKQTRKAIETHLANEVKLRSIFPPPKIRYRAPPALDFRAF